MPPRARKADDTMKVSVLLNVEVSEAKWRAYRKGQGKDMAGVVGRGHRGGDAHDSPRGDRAQHHAAQTVRHPMTAPWWFWVILVVGFSIGGYIPAGWKAYKWLRRRRNSRAETGLFQQKSERHIPMDCVSLGGQHFPGERDGSCTYCGAGKPPAADCQAYAATGEHVWEVGGTCGFCDAVVDPLDLE